MSLPERNRSECAGLRNYWNGWTGLSMRTENNGRERDGEERNMRKYIEESRTASTSSVKTVAPTTMNDAQSMQDRRRLGQRRRVTLNNHRACDKPRTSDINQSPNDSATTPVPPRNPRPSRAPQRHGFCARARSIVHRGVPTCHLQPRTTRYLCVG